MLLTLIQSKLHWENRKANLAMFANKLSKVGQTDVVLLPEMFTTGFSMNPQQFAAHPQEIEEWLAQQAKKYDIAICGSAMVKENDKYYNRFFFTEPNGAAHVYNKKHLFTLAGEEKIYTAGTEQILIEYKGWRIKPLVCYDLRFPVWSRNIQDYDVLLYVANWPTKRSEAWKNLLKARAIENMAYVAGLNRVGEDGNAVPHSGDSSVHDPLGKELVICGSNAEEIKTVTLDKSYLVQQRQRFGFLGDRDGFEFLD